MKIDKLTLTKISVSDTNKEGQKLVSKNGKPFYKVGIQTAQHAEKWLNGLVFGDRPNWQEGDEVELAWGEEEYNGVKRLKFEIPKKEDKTLVELNGMAIKIGVIQNDVKKIIDHLSGVRRLDLNSDGSEGPKF